MNWARYWRPQIQGYLHAYRSVTGVDLSVDVTNARIDATMPSVHLREAAGRAAAQRLSDDDRAMPDFTSALYLGFTHPSASLPPWRALTLGRPAALEEHAGGRALARELAQLIGGEAGILYPSTLHLFRDVFQVAAPKGTIILFDSASYPIARWGAEGASLNGVPTETFPHHDAVALERRVRKARRAGQRPLIVADGFAHRAAGRRRCRRSRAWRRTPAEAS